MIDFRYHLVSLIAVFLAVALGIVIGTTQLNGPLTDNLQAQVTALQARERNVIGELTGTAVVARAILRAVGLISTLPDGPEKDRLLAEQEAARVRNEAHRAVLLLELADVRQQLASATAALDAQKQAVVALTATVAADTAQLAAIDARLAAIAVELSHDRCDPPNGR